MRRVVGVWLVIGGIIPFIPPGPGMIPVGFTLLSVDHAVLRRPRRRLVVWGGRKLKAYMRRRAAKLGSAALAPETTN